jgi:hypothetical protein
MSVKPDLSADEALVLFELLSRYSETERLDVVDEAERIVLLNLLCSLESTLVPPLREDYAELLRQARDRVAKT